MKLHSSIPPKKMNPDQDPHYFLELQTSTGWGQILASFARWCAPRPGQYALDVGCGPGLLPALFAKTGAFSIGIDRDPEMLKTPLHPGILRSQASRLPFKDGSFDLITASNVLYLNPDPLNILADMVRVTKPGAWICLLNPSEKMSLHAAADLADQRGLKGLARETLLNYGERAEENNRWTSADLSGMFGLFGLTDYQTTLKMGPGLVRYARGRKPF